MKALLIATTGAAALLVSACEAEPEIEEQPIAAETAPVGTAGEAAVAWDADNDGVLDRVEYTAWQERGFTDWDLDQDDRLSRDEFNTGWTSTGFGDSEGAFTRFDANEDEFLTEDEWFSESAWEQWDANTNETLDQDEFQYSS